MSMSVDSGLFATLVGRYNDRDVALFQVSGQVLADMGDGTWTGPVAFRILREEGAMVTMEIHDLRDMFERGWNGVVEQNTGKSPSQLGSAGRAGYPTP